MSAKEILLSEDTFLQLEQFSAGARARNEAETRHKLINLVLQDILAWPRNALQVEERIQGGFADYVLHSASDEPLLVVEAKREGIYFELPLGKVDERSGHISLEKLLSDGAIRAAVTQSRAYAIDLGAEFAAITNGHERVFFRAFAKGRPWEKLHAFVVRTPLFFKDDYTVAYNTLSHLAVTREFKLTELLNSTSPKDRNLFFPKEGIASYSHQITANKLAGTLRPIVTNFFGVIGDSDADFMNRCYVSEREYKPALTNIRTLIQDSLSPYFKSYGVQQLEDTGKGGQLGGKLSKNLKHGRKGEVLVLFGGKGAGKSTFLKRLLHHQPPRWLKDHSVIALIDLLKVPESATVIREAIWDGLVSSLDPNNLLESDRQVLLRELFSDRFAIAERQELSGLSKISETYNLRLNQLVADWKADKRYCATRLVEYWKLQGKGLIVVVDNTDQYSGVNQDFCFTSAQEISSLFGCVAVISMREERFFNSKIHGVLDAFQNSGFHISSPRPSVVFRKRLQYIVEAASTTSGWERLGGGDDRDLVSDCIAYLNILSGEFATEKSPLTHFLTACAQGDIRLSLDLFRDFLLSGYTNVEEMLRAGRWNFLIHQVIKPIMTPNRYFYDEMLSSIPNVYQVRDSRNGSHFTGLRVLRKLAKTFEGSSPTYLSVAELNAYFAETFNMVSDLHKNLDVLLKHGFLESNNRMDFFDEQVDSVKVTNYGMYMFSELAYNFTYLDLICTDCGIFSEETANYLSEAGKREYNLFTRGERTERVEVRLDRVAKFLDYLKAEEFREREMYRLGMPEDDMFTVKSIQAFESERTRVLESAKRQEQVRGWRRGGRAK